MSRTLARLSLSLLVALSTFGYLGSSAQAEENLIDIGSKYTVVAPADWVKKEPKIKFIEFEFEIPKADGDERPGRVTVMGAGGGVEANVERWKGQFKSDAGEVKADIKKSKVAEQDVYMVDIKGTYIDKPGGPFSPGTAVDRENYRMIGAVISTDKGDYFVKAYGPAKTMEKAQADIQKMVDGMKAK